MEGIVFGMTGGQTMIVLIVAIIGLTVCVVAIAERNKPKDPSDG